MAKTIKYHEWVETVGGLLKISMVYALRESRYGSGDDYFYETTSPTRKTIKKIDESNTKLKWQIVEWWDSLER